MKIWLANLLAILVAVVLIPNLATAQIENNASYCDVLSASPPSSCSPGISETVYDSTPLSFQGAYGEVYSSTGYYHYVGSGTSTGYLGPTFWSGNSAVGSGTTSDTIMLTGGTGTGQGAAILKFSQASNAPGTVVYTVPGLVDNNPYQGSNFSATLEIGSPYVWPGGGWGAQYFQGWDFTGNPQYTTSLSGSTNYTFDQTKQTLTIPFSFVYGASGPLSTSFSFRSFDGAIVQMDVSLSFELPPGTIMTAASGTQYPVTYISGSSGGGATDGPLPLWAIGALGVGLVSIASRRLKNAT